jgi:hypothetical protein
MKVLYIETFTRAMKKKGTTQGKAELDGYPLTIDLDNLFIVMGRDSFELARIPGTKGGYRYFFLCPDCGRRCRKLYKRYLYFSCGTCQQIHKQTLNRSKTDCQYYFNLALKEARKVEPSYYPEKGYVDYDNFPSRPKRMRAKTYWRHYRKFTSYLDKGLSYWLGGLR